MACDNLKETSTVFNWSSNLNIAFLTTFLTYEPSFVTIFHLCLYVCQGPVVPRVSESVSDSLPDRVDFRFLFCTKQWFHTATTIKEIQHLINNRNQLQRTCSVFVVLLISDAISFRGAAVWGIYDFFTKDGRGLQNPPGRSSGAHIASVRSCNKGFIHRMRRWTLCANRN